MPSSQSSQIERRYTHFTLRLGILLGSFLITAWVPAGQAQQANAHYKETFTYKRVGDLEIKADVYRPAGAGPHPAIVWIHGGGLIFGSRAAVPADENDLFLRAGYITVAIDYRLAPENKASGYPRRCRRRLSLGTRKGTRSVPMRSRTTGRGGSIRGAYLALMSGARLHPSPKVVVSFYGYGDIAGPWLSQPSPSFLSQPRVTKEAALEAISRNEISEADVEPRMDFYIYCRQNGLWPKLVAGYDPLKEQEKLVAYSPDRLVKPGYPPTLLLHGDRDTDVPFQLSERMAAALQRQHIEHNLYCMRASITYSTSFQMGFRLQVRPSACKISSRSCFPRSVVVHRQEYWHRSSEQMTYLRARGTIGSIHAKSLVPYRQCSVRRNSRLRLRLMRSSVDTALGIYHQNEAGIRVGEQLVFVGCPA